MNGEKILKSNKHYTYNSDSQKYVFHTEKKFGQNLVFSKSQINVIIKLYSKRTGNMTSNEIALKLSLPSDVVRHILRVMNITHNSLPFSDEEIEEKKEEILVEDAVSAKKFQVLQKIERNEWRKTVEDAENWKLFQHNYLQIIDNVLKDWSPPKYAPVSRVKQNSGKNELIVGCSDWHFGLFAEERYLYNQKGWNIEQTVKAVEDYGNQICNHLINNPKKYRAVNLAFLGDLIHGLDGLTDKGTRLEAHPLNEEQIEVAYETTLKFLKGILEVSGEVRVYAVPGNHSSFGDYLLLKMLSIYFRNEKRISFNVTNKRFINFTIGNSSFIMDHGYAPTAKSRLPAPGVSRENYINNLFLAKPESMQAKYRYFLSADQHHMEAGEMTNVENYMFSSLIGGCKYADHSGYKTRPRQNALVVCDKLGVTELLHFYCDV